MPNLLWRFKSFSNNVANMELPSIDQNVCGSWTEQQIDLYNKLPFYFMEGQAQYRKYWATYEKLFGKVQWKPNMGDTMRTVIPEPTPVMRQTAFPELLSVLPKTDVINYLERTLDSKPRWQDFMSPSFYFLPEFQDFMKHIDKTMENINRQITIFEDVFYRTQILSNAPYVYVSGVGLIPAPTAEMNAALDATDSKTAAWFQNEVVIPLLGVQDGTLSFKTLFQAFNAGEQEIGMTPYEGTGMPKADSSPLNEKFALIASNEDWNNFVDDPWLKENRPLNMNIVTDGFRGDFFGRIVTKLERYPLRFALDANGVPSLPNPEVTELNSAVSAYHRTKPNPVYAKPSGTTAGSYSPIAMALLVGGPNYDVIESGPPPASFTSDMAQPDALKMNWNGKAYMTKNVLVPCKDADGNTFYDANSFGRYLRLQATTWVGARAANPQNILPIFFKRRIGLTTVT